MLPVLHHAREYLSINYEPRGSYESRTQPVLWTGQNVSKVITYHLCSNECQRKFRDYQIISIHFQPRRFVNLVEYITGFVKAYSSDIVWPDATAPLLYSILQILQWDFEDADDIKNSPKPQSATRHRLGKNVIAYHVLIKQREMPPPCFEKGHTGGPPVL